jgi:hypothetical protein
MTVYHEGPCSEGLVDALHGVVHPKPVKRMYGMIGVMCLITNRLVGPGRPMDDTVWGAGIVQGSRGICSLARVSDALGMKHLVSHFGLTLTSAYLDIG